MSHSPTAPPLRCRVLHLEDSPDEAFLIRRALVRAGLEPEITVADTGERFHAALAAQEFDVVLSDSSVRDFSSIAALQAARARFPGIPFFCISSAPDLLTQRALQSAGIVEQYGKDQPERLVEAVRRALRRPRATPAAEPPPPLPSLGGLTRETGRLVLAIQQLSLARSVEAIREIVRRAARELTGADGATFVLREGDQCHYVDEDAISPLWKGQKFPIASCISGWAMLNRQPAVIEDIFLDPRIPHDAYRPTFVQSLVMVPIRTAAPIGAIGNYWARRRQPTPQQVELLAALADSTSVAMENVQVYTELEQRVRDRTIELEAANRELEAFSYSVSHDLRAPLNVIGGFTKLVIEDHGAALPPEGLSLLERTRGECGRMRALIEDLLRLAQITRLNVRRETVDLSTMARELAERLRAAQPQRSATFEIEAGLRVNGDAGLLRAALENLLSNAWKYSGKVAHARIAFGRCALAEGGAAFFVRDNGAGFDPAHAGLLFAPFQRLHRANEFPGTGVGLATVQRIIAKHGGRIWAEARPGEGATFFFTLPAALTAA